MSNTDLQGFGIVFKKGTKFHGQYCIIRGFDERDVRRHAYKEFGSEFETDFYTEEELKGFNKEWKLEKHKISPVVLNYDSYRKQDLKRRSQTGRAVMTKTGNQDENSRTN